MKKCDHFFQVLKVLTEEDPTTKYGKTSGALVFCQKCLELGGIDLEEWKKEHDLPELS